MKYSNLETYTIAKDLLSDECIERLADYCEYGDVIAFADELRDYVLTAWDQACEACETTAQLEMMQYAHNYIMNVKFDEIANEYFKQNEVNE